jgi:hypothetical protein
MDENTLQGRNMRGGKGGRMSRDFERFREIWRDLEPPLRPLAPLARPRRAAKPATRAQSGPVGRQDGGAGMLGEVTGPAGDGWVSVRWLSNGGSNSYRVGPEFDLARLQQTRYQKAMNGIATTMVRTPPPPPNPSPSPPSPRTFWSGDSLFLSS